MRIPHLIPVGAMMSLLFCLSAALTATAQDRSQLVPPNITNTGPAAGQKASQGVVGHIGAPSPRTLSLRKQPSDWTLEERLASRCSVAQAEERVRQAQSQFPTARLARVADIISGRTHPELFLPHELFETIVTGASFDPAWRRVYQPLAKAAGLPSNFWDTLQTLSKMYVADLQQRRRQVAATSASDRALAIAAAPPHFEQQMCRDRTDALRAARAAFGPALDHFMYDYVARNRTDYLDAVSNEDLLRVREGDCR